ncbi:hypothetical protein Hanom_Chr09g00869981 [Helianthus anomalus]
MISCEGEGSKDVWEEIFTRCHHHELSSSRVMVFGGGGVSRYSSRVVFGPQRGAPTPWE